MFSARSQEIVGAQLGEIRSAGTWKEERQIASPQGVEITVGGRRVLNFCANNYLGLSNHPDVVAAAKRAIGDRGYGLSSVRFICGTQDSHRDLEQKLAEFFVYDDSVLFGSCFDANGGVFEALLGEQDAIISDALNHASIIDGVRLCKASATDIRTATWRSWRSSCRPPKRPGCGWWSPTASFRWTEISRSSIGSASSRKSMMPW